MLVKNYDAAIAKLNEILGTDDYRKLVAQCRVIPCDEPLQGLQGLMCVTEGNGGPTQNLIVQWPIFGNSGRLRCTTRRVYTLKDVEAFLDGPGPFVACDNPRENLLGFISYEKATSDGTCELIQIPPGAIPHSERPAYFDLKKRYPYPLPLDQRQGSEGS